MTIGQGSIGEFSIAELPTSGGSEISVGGRGIFNLTASSPEILAGAIVDSSAATMSLLPRAPILQVGTLINMPVGVLNIQANAPQILQSVNLLADKGTVQLVANEPNLGTGVFIDNPSRQDSYTSLSGSIASYSIAEFAIGEGAPEVTLSGRRTARLGLRAGGEFKILAGKTIDVPVSVLTLISRVPEPSSRGRRLRTQAILS